jgi:O-antigen/teichoic acid export membrane protein
VVALALGDRLVRVAASNAPASGRAAAPVAIAPLARDLVPFAVTVTLGMLYFRQDVLVVGALRSSAETGLYGVAATLYALTLLLPSAAMAALYPRLSASFVRSPLGFRSAAVKATALLTLAGAAAGVSLAAIASPLVTLLYGPAFAGAVPTLRLLALMLPFHGANAALGQAMQAAHLQRQMLGLTAATVAVNLAALLVLVPRHGIEGAALSLLPSCLFSVALALVIFQRHFGRRALAAAAAATGARA